MEPNFVVQFGIHGDPKVNAIHAAYEIPDDPFGPKNNTQYTLAFGKRYQIRERPKVSSIWWTIPFAISTALSRLPNSSHDLLDPRSNLHAFHERQKETQWRDACRFWRSLSIGAISEFDSN